MNRYIVPGLSAMPFSLRIAVSAAVVAMSSWAANAPSTILYVPYVDGYGIDYGRGFNSKTNTVLDPCVNGNAPSQDYTAGRRSSKLARVDDWRDLEDELNVQISQSVKPGLFRDSSDVKMMNDLKISETSVTYVAMVEIRGQDWIMTDPVLTDSSRDLYTNKPGEFVRKCGDYFVAGFATGGKYMGTVNIQTSSMEDKNTVVRTVEQQLNALLQRNEQEVDNTLNTTLKSHDMVLEEYKTDGVAIQNAGDFNALIANFRQLSPQQAPGKYMVILKSYGSLASVDMEATDLSALEYVFSQLGREKIDLKMVVNDIDHITRYPGEFPAVNLAAIATLRGTVMNDLASIDRVASTCPEQIGPCQTLASTLADRAASYRASLPRQGH